MKIAAFGLLTLITGCGVRSPDVSELIGNGEAITQARGIFNGQRECAPLLNGSWPVVQSAALLDSDGVRALVAAGLFRLEPGGPDAAPTDRRLTPTAEGQRHLKIVPTVKGVPAQAALCFARKQVVSVTPEPARTPDQVPGIGVAYRLIDVAPWAQRPDVAAAYPFIGEMAGRTLHPFLYVTLDRDEWRIRRSRFKATSDVETTPPREMPEIRFTSCDLKPATQANIPCR